MKLINSVNNITENKFDWNIVRAKQERNTHFWQVGRNGFLGEMMTAEGWIKRSRAHVQVTQFTSGSRILN